METKYRVTMSLLKLELDPRHATTRSRGHKGERGKVEVIVSTYDLGADTSLVCEGHRWEDPIAAKRKPITNSRDNTMRYSTKRKTQKNEKNKTTEIATRLELVPSPVTQLN